MMRWFPMFVVAAVIGGIPLQGSANDRPIAQEGGEVEAAVQKKTLCFNDNFNTGWQVSLLSVGSVPTSVGFGTANLITDPLPWTVFGTATTTNVSFSAKNPVVSGFECCQFTCQGRLSGSTISGTCTNPDNACNRKQGCVGRTTGWGAFIFTCP
jgi:hypothetical protein